MPSLRDLPALADVVAALGAIDKGAPAEDVIRESDRAAEAGEISFHTAGRIPVMMPTEMVHRARAALAALERVVWEEWFRFPDEAHVMQAMLYNEKGLKMVRDLGHGTNDAEPVAVLPLKTEDADCICVPCPKCGGSGKALRRKDTFCPRCDGGSEDDKDRCVCEPPADDAETDFGTALRQFTEKLIPLSNKNEGSVPRGWWDEQERKLAASIRADERRKCAEALEAKADRYDRAAKNTGSREKSQTATMLLALAGRIRAGRHPEQQGGASDEIPG